MLSRDVTDSGPDALEVRAVVALREQGVSWYKSARTQAPAPRAGSSRPKSLAGTRTCFHVEGLDFEYECLEFRV